MDTSLIIPTHERAHLLERSFGRLAELTVPEQIIVVDDGGTDNTRAVCEEARRRHGLPILYMYNNNPGSTNCCLAKNIGLRHAEHEHLITTEPEVMFLTDAVAQFVAAREDEEWQQRVICERKAYHAPHEEASLEECDDAQPFYATSFMRGWLYEVGGWDESFPDPWGWDDIDLYGRLDHLGHGRTPLPGIEILHQWHPSRVELAVKNEAHCRGKKFPRDLIANRGIRWGALRT
jgi:glycosyltransferase involved in cell wall biosynthesis